MRKYRFYSAAFTDTYGKLKSWSKVVEFDNEQQAANAVNNDVFQGGNYYFKAVAFEDITGGEKSDD